MRAIERDPANRYQTAASMALDLEGWGVGRLDPRPALAALVTARASSLDRSRGEAISRPATPAPRCETSATVVEIPGPISSKRARLALESTELDLAPAWTPAERATQPIGGTYWRRWLAAVAIACSLAVLVSSFEPRNSTAHLLPPPSRRPSAAVVIVPLPAPAAVTRATPPAADQAPPRQVQSLRRSSSRMSHLVAKRHTPRAAKGAPTARGQRGHKGR
jgi:hypothetical protein